MEKLWLAALALYLALGAFDPVCAEDTGLNLKGKGHKPKPGQCPRLRRLGVCAELCSADFECPKDEKCCSYACGHVCIAPLKEIPPKPGQCPRLHGLGVCADLCSADSECPNDEKCCSHTCGHVCIAPLRVVPPKPKPGQCPRREDIPSIVCVRPPCACEFCSVDSNCPKDEKCCSNTCGHVCVDPLPVIPPKPKPGQCPRREDIPSIVCVRPPCACEFCSADSNCPNDEKCCSNACGHVCVDPIKVVPPKQKPGQCPRREDIPSIVCVRHPCTCEFCSTDSNCPKDKKCCSNTCGHVCTTPLKADQGPMIKRPGRCIGPQGPSNVAAYCNQDNQCPGDMKCCKDPCSWSLWPCW